MRRAPIAVALAFGLAFTGGCKKKDPDADGTKLTADSTYDATKPIEHEGYRFRLESPGTGWKLTQTEDTRRLVPDAVAGAVNTDGRFGAVIVERVPGLELEGAVEWLDGMLEGATFESTDPTTVDGLPAMRSVYVMSIEGLEFRYLRVVFLREGFLYQLMSWGTKSNVSVSDLEPFVRAFSLTEGTVEGVEDDRPPVEQADGINWRIRDGRFEGVVSGLSIERPEGWRFLVGEELANSNAEAELGLTHRETSAYLLLISERFEGEDPSGLIAIVNNNLREGFGEPTEAGTERISGHDVPFRRYTSGPMEFHIGILSGKGAVTQVLAWYPTGLRDSALPHCRAAIEALRVLSAPERETLREELLDRPGVLWQATRHTSFLGDTFRDFAHRVTWTQPRGLYDVALGDRAKADAPSAVLSVTDTLGSVYGVLEVVEGDGGRVEEIHEGLAGTLRDRKDEPYAVSGLLGSRSTGVERIDGADFLYSVASFSHGGHAVVFGGLGPGRHGDARGDRYGDVGTGPAGGDAGDDREGRASHRPAVRGQLRPSGGLRLQRSSTRGRPDSRSRHDVEERTEDDRAGQLGAPRDPGRRGMGRRVRRAGDARVHGEERPDGHAEDQQVDDRRSSLASVGIRQGARRDRGPQLADVRAHGRRDGRRHARSLSPQHPLGVAQRALSTASRC